MIKLRIAALCEERLIKHAYTALVKAGISAVKARQYLDSKTNRLMLDDTEILCRLLHCHLTTWWNGHLVTKHMTMKEILCKLSAKNHRLMLPIY